MANLEFPKNTNTASNKENVESINKTSKANTDKIIKAIQIAMMANAQATADEWYKKDRAKGIAKADAEQKIDSIGNNIKKAMSPITDGLKEIGSKVADSVKSATDNVYTEVFGSGLIAESIKNALGKTLKKISDSLSFIGEWLFKKGGNLIKKILVGSLVFFGWLKKFLMKSMLFKAIGSIAKMAWSGITGTLSLGGDLIGAIAAKLVGTAAWKALTSGVTHLGELFKGLTLKGILKSIGEFLASLIPKGVAGALAGIVTALTPTPAGDPDEMRYIGALNRGEIDKNTTMEEWRETDKAKQDDYKKNVLPKIQKQEEESYNKWLKEYPTIANELFKKRWLIDADKNDDGYRDYNSERYNTFKTLVENPNNQILLDNYDLSKESREELKNKSILKNAAGVSST